LRYLERTSVWKKLLFENVGSAKINCQWELENGFDWKPKQKEKRKTLTDLYRNDKGHEQKIQRTLNKVHGDPLYRPEQ
jgi:hypothetical protein